ncbi:hypothetical protein ABT269_14965 [Streptomyces viridosporus]|uniref:hypothetical protein n=1 Tax=Streptomyces viridosporus TaxID=67581 RepID=UPI003324A5DE
MTHQVARRQLDSPERRVSGTERVEPVVASAVLFFEPAPRALHRSAREEQSTWRHGIE